MKDVGDVLADVDRTLEGRCACGCGARLDPEGPSAYFATQDCQREWAGTAVADRPGEVYNRPDADHYPIPPVEAGPDQAMEAVGERLRMLREMVSDVLVREVPERTAAGSHNGRYRARGDGHTYTTIGWTSAENADWARRFTSAPGAGWRIVYEWDSDDDDITVFGEAFPARYMPRSWYTVRLIDGMGREVARERRRGDVPL